MRAGVKTAVVFIGGLLSGLVSAQLAIPYSGRTIAGGGTNWYTYQTGESPQPYQRAHYLLSGRLPPPHGLLFEAETSRDSQGSLLDGDCTYLVALGPQPKPWWRLYADTGQAAINPHSAANSHSILTGADGRVTIAISPEPQPGNWLDPGTTGGYRLVYTVALDEVAQTQPPPPLVKRAECR